MKCKIILVFCLLLTGTGTIASAVEACTSLSRVGDRCVAGVLSIRPTQFAVGLREVAEKRRKLERLSQGDLQKYLKKHAAPAIKGPGQTLYILDRHHLSRALFESGRQELYIDIAMDYSHLSEPDFRATMERSGKYYLFDENGIGPKLPSELPTDVRGLKDDIYRGLAWFVQKETDAFEDDESDSHAKFKWADYFRARIPKDVVESNFDRAIEMGAELACDTEAQRLPGYNRGRCLNSSAGV